MKRICILCLLAALLLGACGLADAPYMEPVRTYCAALQDDDFTRLQEAIPPAVLNADGFDAGELANVRDSFAKGSSNDYDITPKELDSRRIPESGCPAAASPRAAAACSRIISASSTTGS